MSSINKNGKKIDKAKIMNKLARKETLKSIGNELGISGAYLSMIISGKRKLNPENQRHNEIIERLHKI